MSNRRKISMIRTEPLPVSIKMAELQLKLEGKGRVLDRRMRRRLRQSSPLAAFLTDHSVPHAREDSCGPKCKATP